MSPANPSAHTHANSRRMGSASYMYTRFGSFGSFGSFSSFGSSPAYFYAFV